MRFLNDCIAREATAEDRCAVRFREGRFKSQVLLDEAGVTACMVYVDLNPIRAGVAEERAGSDFTTIQRRLRSLADDPAAGGAPLESLAGVRGPAALSLTVSACIDLVDCTGRITRSDKRGSMVEEAARALDAIRGSPDWWVGCVGRIEEVFASAVGVPRTLKQSARDRGLSCLHGVAAPA